MNDTKPVGAESPRSLLWTLGRTVLLGGLAVAVLFAGAAWLVGQQLAPRLRAALEQAGERAGLRIEDWHVARGIRSSRLEARLVAAGCHQHCAGARLVGRVHHGPLWSTGHRLVVGLAGFDGRLVLEAAPAGPVLAALPPARLHGQVNLLGRGTAHAVMPAFNTAIRRAPEGAPTGRLVGAQSRAALAFDITGAAPARWQLAIPRLARDDAVAGRVALRGLAARGPVENHRADLKVRQVTVDNGHGQATRAQDITLSLAQLKPARYQLTLKAGAVLLADNQNARLAARAAGNPQGLTAVFKSVAGWRALGGRAGGALNRSVFYSQTIAPALADARLEADAALVSADQRLDVRLALRGPADLGGPINAVDVLSALEARARVGLSDGWARRLAARVRPPAATDDAQRAVAATLDTLARRALIQRDGAGYVTSRARLADGRLFINGRARPEWRSVVEQLQAAAPGL